MSRKKKQQPRHSTRDGGFELSRLLRPLCVSAAVALTVATPLVPSERTELTGAALPMVMLWLLLALVWLGGAALSRPGGLRFAWADAALLALVGWICVSGLVMMHTGAPRSTINAIWTWVGFGVTFVMLRQVISTPRQARALCAVMIALAVCLSVMGVYQTFVLYPQSRALYAQNPEESLRQAGVHAPPGSVQRQQFEDRLGSTEPTATFSLTNSLAGYLGPWLVLLLGVWLAARRSWRTDRKWWFVLAVCAAPAAFCLLLTQSRTAWLAILLGAGAMVVLSSSRWFQWKWLLLAAGGFAVLISLSVVLASSGVLDIQILSQAGKSFLYRLEYWQSTATMIGEYPLFGCGVGNFQEYYTAYKLPQASETISDPHNFLMEIAATAGLPALVLTLLFIGVALWNLLCNGTQISLSCDGNRPDLKRDAVKEKTNSPGDRAVYVGALCGVPLALLLGLTAGFLPDAVSLLAGVCLAVTAVWLLSGWVQAGVLPRSSVGIAIGTLLVNLLAAGGISFPGVAITLWVMFAVLFVPKDQSSEGEQSAPSRTTLFIIFVILAALLLAAYQSAYRPVLTRMGLLGQAGKAQARGRFEGAINLTQQAAVADPWSYQPHQQLARLQYHLWHSAVEADGTGEHPDFKQFERHAAAALALNARSHAAHAAIGYLYLEAFEHTGARPLIDEAVRLLRRSVDLYPNDAMAHAQLAWALQLQATDEYGSLWESNPQQLTELYRRGELGIMNHVQRHAETALDNDELCPHTERKLKNRRLFAEFTDRHQQQRMLPLLQETNARDLMQRLLESMDKPGQVDLQLWQAIPPPTFEDASP